MIHGSHEAAAEKLNRLADGFETGAAAAGAFAEMADTDPAGLQDSLSKIGLDEFSSLDWRTLRNVFVYAREVNEERAKWHRGEANSEAALAQKDS